MNRRFVSGGMGHSCAASFVTTPVEPCQLRNSPVRSGSGLRENQTGETAQAPVRTIVPSGSTASRPAICSPAAPWRSDMFPSPSIRKFAITLV